MAIEPIGSADGVGSVTAAEAFAVDYLNQSHAGPQQIALAEAKAQEQQTTEQRAASGDPIATIQLAREEQRAVPVESQQLQPLHAQHLVGAHEPGKGDLIDIYD